jgi:hypothetical protein
VLDSLITGSSYFDKPTTYELGDAARFPFLEPHQFDQHVIERIKQHASECLRLGKGVGRIWHWAEPIDLARWNDLTR